MEKIRVLIADDHRMVRESWTYIIESDPRFKVIAVCGNSDMAVNLAFTEQPDLVLMDITLPPDSGFEATSRIKKRFPAIRVMALTMHAAPSYLKRMLECGADGYLTKNSSKEEMIEALLAVKEGKKFICLEMSRQTQDAA